jgi:hypothetical protein
VCPACSTTETLYRWQTVIDCDITNIPGAGAGWILGTPDLLREYCERSRDALHQCDACETVSRLQLQWHFLVPPAVLLFCINRWYDYGKMFAM